MKKFFTLSVPKIALILALTHIGEAIYLHVSPKGHSFLTYLELKLLDTKFQTRKPQQPDPRIVIISIDDESIKKFGRWPWDRRILAQALKNLKEAGPTVTGMDVVFSEKDPLGGDGVFAEHMKYMNNLVLGYFFYFDKDLPSQKKLPSLINLKIEDEKPLFSEWPKAQSVEMNISPISLSTSHHGFFDFHFDEDAGVRRGNLIVQYQEGFYPSFALKVAALYLDKNIGVRLDRSGIQSVFLDDHIIPCDEKGRLLVNYRGGKNTFPHYSFSDLYDDRLDPSLLKDKIVLFGVTAKALQDLRNTPFSTDMAGVEVHANIIDNILNQNYIVRSDSLFLSEILFMLLLGLLLGWSLNKFKSKVGSIYTIGLTGAIFLTDEYLLFTRGLWVHTVLIFIQIYITYVNALLYKYFIEEKRAREIKAAFEHYLAPSLVAELIKNPQKLKLGGEKKYLTVLFADIQGFTTLSEKLDPQLLTAMTNEYMNEMTEIIFEHGGLIDKYMGDAIMVIYGAPIEDLDHGKHAVETGVAMLKKLKEINEKWENRKLPPFHIGVGANTGDMLVGNMGSSRIFDYTVVGDAVNVASRIEKASRYYKVPFIITEETHKHLSSRHLMRKLDIVQVRGRERGTALYEVMMCDEHELEAKKEFIQFYEEALKFYQKREFEQALIQFKNAEEVEPDDEPVQIFKKRCEELLLKAPSENWHPIHTIPSA